MDETNLTFAQWMNKLNTIVSQKVGLSVFDLPEHDYRSYYDARQNPEDCYDLNLRDELEDLGFSLEIADLDEAQELGMHKDASHVLAEANLDYLTDEPFDTTAGDFCSDAF